MDTLTSGSEAGSPDVVPAKPNTFFSGPNGIHPGWRVGMYLLMVVLCAVVLVLFLGLLFKGRPGGNLVQAISEAAVVFAAFAPALVMAKIEKRPFGDFGLPRATAFGRDFWMGAVWGIVSLSVLLLFIYALHDFSMYGIALHGGRAAAYALFYAGFFLMVGFFEEFMFRGYTLFTLNQQIGFWPAAIALSTLFGVIHLSNKGEAWIGALAAGLIGLFFCLTLRRTGTLWWAVGFHASWDWAESYLYSVPDSGMVSSGHLLNTSFQGSKWISGGSVGPEGSLFVLLVIAILWIAFDRMYPTVKFPVPAPASLPGPTPVFSHQE